MSTVKTAAKIGQIILGIFVALLVLIGIALYVKGGAFGKELVEKIASTHLGVEVTIDNMDISLEEKKVVLTGIKIANPAGYKGLYAISIEKILVAAESFSPELLSFNNVVVSGAKFNLEVNTATTNLNDLRNQSEHNSNSYLKAEDTIGLKIIIRNLVVENPVIVPVVTLEPTKYAAISGTPIYIRDVGTKNNGSLIPSAIAEVMLNVVTQINLVAMEAELFKGMSLDTMNAIGLSTIDVFSKNVNKKIEKDLGQAKELFDNLLNSDLLKGDSSESKDNEIKP